MDGVASPNNSNHQPRDPRGLYDPQHDPLHNPVWWSDRPNFPLHPNLRMACYDPGYARAVVKWHQQTGTPIPSVFQVYTRYNLDNPRSKMWLAGQAALVMLVSMGIIHLIGKIRSQYTRLPNT